MATQMTQPARLAWHHSSVPFYHFIKPGDHTDRQALGMAFGEYACDLDESDYRNKHVCFTRELWSRNFVVKHVAAHVRSRSETHAMLHAGHVVVSIDGVSVSGLSMRRFAELWAPGSPGSDVPATLETTTTARRAVQFCDRRRADLEVAMQTVLVTAAAGAGAASAAMQFATRQERSERIAQCRDWIWSHRLDAAEDALMALVHVGGGPVDPMLLVTRLEVALVRVLISNDASHIKCARETAKQTVYWLQLLSDLPSLSVASRVSVRIALAEAFLMSSALLFIAERTMKGMAEFRRCAATYGEINQQFAVPRLGSKMPDTMFQTLQARLQFGLGVMQLSSAMTLQGFEWVRSMINVAFDPAKALDNLLACCDVANPRSVWASLALSHSSSAIRRIQQSKNGGDLGDKYAKQVARIQQQYLQQYPDSVLHLWSASMSEASYQGTTTPQDYVSRAVALSPSEERAHLLRFDLGYRHFVRHDVESAAPLFMAICKCASAPSKLRGLCSIFLACGYLLLSEPHRTPRDQLFNSVRLLLRSALRFFDQARVNDAEAACLSQRMSVYIDSCDRYLRLLPCEILYVYCYSYSSTASWKSDASQEAHKLHERALLYLNQFELRGTSVAAMGLLNFEGKVIKMNSSNQQQAFSLEAQAISEWSVLRASVLYHLGRFHAAQQQLETLQDLLPRVPTHSFVAALVTFYRLQIHLRHHSDPPDPIAKEPQSSIDDLGKNGDLQYEYSYLYAGKLKALVTLTNKRRMYK